MKLWVLAENTACREDLVREHGLSLYIQFQGKTILFDMGQSDAFARNAGVLGLDLSAVDAAVISHGHYDHGGGLGTFLEINSAAPVYLSRYAFQPHFNGAGKDIGLDPRWADHPRVRLISGSVTLFPGLTLIPCPLLPGPEPDTSMTVREEGRLCREDFRHELYLEAEEDGQRILFTGCAHRGILRIGEYFRPDVLIGGFHLKDMADPNRLDSVCRGLQALPARYCTGHCTGGEAFLRLKSVLGSRLEPLSTGMELTL